MSYKTVMVSLALDWANNTCLSVAGDLAERSGARGKIIVDPCVAADLGDLAYGHSRLREWILGA